MSELTERFAKIETRVNDAIDAVRGDTGASPVLVVVVEEFARKIAKAKDPVSSGDIQAAFEAVLEAEQAADSAKYAAEADSGISDAVREAIVAAHDRICVMKTKWGS